MKKYLSLLAVIIISSALVVGVVSAATTISTNINTGGTLSVTGTSTLLGNVGIGTSTPTSKLSISGQGSNGFFSISSTTLGDILNVSPLGTVQIGSTTLNDVFDVLGQMNAVSVDGNQAIKISASSQGSPAVNIQFGQYNVYGGLADLRFTSWWGPNTYMTIKGSDASGNVSIGTAGIRNLPDNQLEIYASSFGTTTIPKTADYSGIKVMNTAISSTNDLIKSGVRISSNGNWTGNNASNIGLYISSVTGGTNNYDAIFNGGGNVGIGTSTPNVSLQVATSTSNATTTMELGKSGQNKGSCLVMYDATGAAKYVSIVGGAFVISSTSCK